MDTSQVVEDILAHHGESIVDDLIHFGVKGMKWGVRKEFATTTPMTARTKARTAVRGQVKGSEHFPKAQATSMNNVAKKMQKGYGLKTDEFVPLTDHEKNYGYLAYVKSKSKTGGKVIHATDNPKLKEVLIDLQNKGWFVKTDPKHAIEANLTHESAHALFHNVDVQGQGMIAASRARPIMNNMRGSAWAKAKETAIANGEVTKHKGFKKLIKPSVDYQVSGQLSKYAQSSLFLEENEAELFTAYHWNPNPPKFVDAFMNDIHRQMGKEVKPFSGRKVSHAS